MIRDAGGVFAAERGDGASGDFPRLGGRASAWIFGVALVVRLVAVAVVGLSTTRFADAPAYLFAAKALSQTGSYPIRTDRDYFRPPGYSIFLAAVTLGHPERIAVAKLANAVLGALAPVLLAAIALRLFRSRAVALLAGAGAALDPSLVLVSSDVQSEPLFLVLLLASAFFLLVCVDRPSSNFGVLAGILLALAALTRPTAMAVAPLLLAPVADRRYPMRARLHLAFSALLGVALGVAPWTLRNAVVYRELLPITDVGGFNFYFGNSEPMTRFFDLRSREEFEAWIVESGRFMDAKVAALRAAGFNTPGRINRALVREILAERLATPRTTLRLFWQKTLDWLRPYPNPFFWPRAAVVGVGVFYAALYGLAAWGLLVAPRRGVGLFCLAVLALSMAAHLLTVVSWRYRVPYWDPILLAYASFALWRLRPSPARRRRDRVSRAERPHGTPQARGPARLALEAGSRRRPRGTAAPVAAPPHRPAARLRALRGRNDRAPRGAPAPAGLGHRPRRRLRRRRDGRGARRTPGRRGPLRRLRRPRAVDPLVPPPLRLRRAPAIRARRRRLALRLHPRRGLRRLPLPDRGRQARRSSSRSRSSRT